MSELKQGAPLITLADAAARIHKHPRTLTRMLPALMDEHPLLKVRRVGRSLQFTEQDFARLLEALSWRSPSANAAKSGTRAARSVSAGKASSSGSSAQERLRERLRSKRQDARKPASAKSMPRDRPKDSAEGT